MKSAAVKSAGTVAGAVALNVTTIAVLPLTVAAAVAVKATISRSVPTVIGSEVYTLSLQPSLNR